MIFPLEAAAALTLATLLPACLVALALRLRRRPVRRFLLPALWLHLGLLPLHLFVTVPAALGYFASRFVGTRPDEGTLSTKSA